MSERTVQIVALVILVCCLGASGLLTASVSASAGRNRLVYTDTAEEGDPEEVAIGIAMGAFRGLFVNILWMRANDHKQEGRYHDAVDLARTITKLQPRFPRVWVFHAWNLAYNVSVTTNTPSERLDWVNQGIRLLRDQAIPKNPNDLLIHKELAWIFLHKIQGYMDDANSYYKKMLAREWTIALGPPPQRTVELIPMEKYKAAVAAWLTRIKDAPDTLDEAMKADERGPELVNRLRDEAGIDLRQPLFTDRGDGPGERLLTLIEEARAMGRVYSATGLGARPSAASESAFSLVMDQGLRPALQAVALHLRKRILIDKYHMEPDRMIRYAEYYGPLDYRHAAAHAVYWAARGVEQALLRVSDENRKDFDFANTDRLVIQGIQDLFRSGDVHYDILNPQFYLAMPSADFIPMYPRILEALSDREAAQWEAKGVRTFQERAYQLYSAGYENFLKDSVRFLWRRGDRDTAREYFEKLITFNKQNMNDPMRALQYAKPLAQWVVDEVIEDERFKVPNVAAQEVLGSLQSAYLNGLLVNNMETFSSSFRYAAEIHAVFVKNQVFNVSVNQGDAARMEVFPRDFELVSAQVLATLIATAGIPDGPVMYRRAPVELQALTYVALEQMNLKQRFEGTGIAGEGGESQFDAFFPPPADLDQWRATLESKLQRARELGNIELK
jgi:tetratricopeptide (TPR) repeat protein